MAKILADGWEFSWHLHALQTSKAYFVRRKKPPYELSVGSKKQQGFSSLAPEVSSFLYGETMTQTIDSAL